MNNLDMEKLKYLLHFTDLEIEEMIDNVLSDLEEDPHYSAVTTANRIKCYIQIMNELGEKLPYSNVEEFFEFNMYTDEEYKTFEKSRKKEAEYYIGKQY